MNKEKYMIQNCFTFLFFLELEVDQRSQTINNEKVTTWKSIQKKSSNLSNSNHNVIIIDFFGFMAKMKVKRTTEFIALDAI